MNVIKKVGTKGVAVGLALVLSVSLAVPAFAAEDEQKFTAKDTVDTISGGIADRLAEEAIGEDEGEAMANAVTTEAAKADVTEVSEDIVAAEAAVEEAGKAAGGVIAVVKAVNGAVEATAERAKEAADALEAAKDAVSARDQNALADAKAEAKTAAERADTALKDAVKDYDAAVEAVAEAQKMLGAAAGEDQIKTIQDELDKAQEVLKEAQSKVDEAQKQSYYAQVYAAVAATLATTKKPLAAGETADTTASTELMELLDTVLKDYIPDASTAVETQDALMRAGILVFQVQTSGETVDPEFVKEAFKNGLEEGNGYVEGEVKGMKDLALMDMMLAGVAENLQGMGGNDESAVEKQRELLTKMIGAYTQGKEYYESNIFEDPDYIDSGTEIVAIYAKIVDEVTAKQGAAEAAATTLNAAIKSYNDAAAAVQAAQEKLDSLTKVDGEGKNAIKKAEAELAQAQKTLNEAQEKKDEAEGNAKAAQEAYRAAVALAIVVSSGSSESAGPVEIEIDEEDIPLASGPVTRAQFVDYLWRHEGKPEAEAPAFDDVAEDHEYAAAIDWARSIGIIEGNGDNTFSPDDLVAVADVRTILTRYAAWAGIEMPELATLTGADSAPVLNCDEVIAEFFGEAPSVEEDVA